MNSTTDNEYIESSRIRSARRRKRAQKEEFDKKLIRLHKEEKEVWKEIRNLGWVELNPPVQRGFIRYFILRDDVKRTKQVPFFENLLKKVNTTQWSSRRDFKKKRKRFGKKFYVVREQNLRDIPECEFLSKRFNEQERLYFYETLTHSTQYKRPFKVYRFTEPWRFVLRVQPNMITKVRVKDLDLEKRGDEISRYFDFENRRYRLWKILFGCYRWRYRETLNNKYENPLRNKSFSNILDEYLPEKQLSISNRNPRSPRVSFCLRMLYSYLSTLYYSRGGWN